MNLADYLLQDVFQGDQTENAAEFVDHDGQADVTGAQFLQQLARGLCLRDDEHLAQNPAQIK